MLKKEMKFIAYASIVVFSIVAIICAVKGTVSETIAFICALGWVVIFLMWVRADEEEGRRWISVKERLPQEYVPVLVTVKHKYCEDDYVDVVIAQNKGHKWSAWDGYVITHWMPLPEPPKEGAE